MLTPLSNMSNETCFQFCLPGRLQEPWPAFIVIKIGIAVMANYN